MVEAGRHVYSLTRPNTPLKQAQLQQVAQDYAQMGFEYLQGERPQNVPRKPVPVFGHPHSKNRCFLIFRGILRLCPSPLALSVGTPEKSLAHGQPDK